MRAESKEVRQGLDLANARLSACQSPKLRVIILYKYSIIHIYFFVEKYDIWGD